MSSFDPITGAGSAVAEVSRPLASDADEALNASLTPWARMARALAHRNYRYFFAGNLASNVGTWMQNVALSWLVLDLAHGNSAFWLGVVGFASSVPMLVFSLIGGVVADRINRRRLLMMTQAAMMLFAFILAGLTWTHTITLPTLALLALATGVAMALMMPAYQAMQTELVPPRDLTNAIALNSAQFNVSRIVGPTLGGFCIAWFGMAGNFLANGLSFLAVIIALGAIQYPRGAAAEGAAHITRDVADGFSYVHGEQVMRALLTLTAIVSLFALPYFTFVPLFARDLLRLDERGFGLLMAISGMGALLGGLTMASMHPRRRGRLVATFASTCAGAIVLFTFSRSFIVSALLLAAIGFSMVMAIANVNALLQQLSSRAMRGRVMSIYTFAFLGLSPIGSLVVGLIAKRTGAPHALAGMGTLALAGILLVWVTQPHLRTLD